MPTFTTELAFAIDTAIEAGREIRRQYVENAADTYTKSDQSPVTDADLASDAIIRGRIAETWPGDAILTEEGVDDSERLSTDRVWIADPIDGTQQFIDRTGQFDVLLALVIRGRPVVSVMLQPTTGVYLAAAQGSGAVIGDETGRTVNLRLAEPGPVPALVTTIWLGAPESGVFLTRVAERAGADAPEIKQTGVIARGHVDPTLDLIAGREELTEILAYPTPAHAFLGLPIRGDGTMAWEWDYVAADLVINEAGGRFTDWHGQPFTYNKPRPRNEGGLVFANSPDLHATLLKAVAPEIELVTQSRREK